MTSPVQITLPTVYRGDTTPFTFNFAVAAVPLNMVGKTVVMLFKFASGLDDTQASLTKSVTPEIGDVAAEGGQVSITLESSDTLKLVAGVTYSFSVKMIEPSSPEPIETTLLYSSVLVEDK